jgi:fumarate reductase flavoprotein subunit
LFHVCFKDIASAPGRLLDAMAGEVPRAVPELSRAVADNGARLIGWMRAQGVRLMRASPDEAFHWVLAPPRSMKAGASVQGRGGDLFLRTLEERLALRGGVVRRGALVEDLLFDGGSVGGVAAVCDGARLRIAAKAVVLADGGFQSNLTMVGAYISPAPGMLFQRGAATGTGDGIRMAAAIGAGLVDMAAFYGHVLNRDVFGNGDLWPYPILDRVIAAGMVVDRSGLRFVDEGRGGVNQANGIARLADPTSAVAIFDDATWNGPGGDFIFPPNPELRRRGGTLHSAPDLDSLAKVAGLPEAALAATVGDYNAAVVRGETAKLHPARSAAPYAPMPILVPPFHAVPVCAGITYTMGGLTIDACARVCDAGGRPIAGLFAAGCTTGGIEGGPHAGYVGGLAKSGITALLAAEAIELPDRAAVH